VLFLHIYKPLIFYPEPFIEKKWADFEIFHKFSLNLQRGMLFSQGNGMRKDEK